MDPSGIGSSVGLPEGLACRRGVRFGAGFRLRRLLVLAGWLLVPLILIHGARTGGGVFLVTTILLVAALWPVTTRFGEVRWDGPTVSVRRYLRFVPLAPGQVEAAVVTPPVFRRQSLVLKLKWRLQLSRYVYCRLDPGSVCDAWALVQDRNWEPRGEHESARS